MGEIMDTSHELTRLVEQGDTAKTRATRLTCGPDIGQWPTKSTSQWTDYLRKQSEDNGNDP